MYTLKTLKMYGKFNVAAKYSSSTRNFYRGIGAVSKVLTIIITASLALAIFTTPANAEVTWSEDVTPTDPTTWGESTNGFIGKTGNGTLNITDGNDIVDSSGFIGFESGSAGEATVDGPGSTWTSSDSLYAGLLGRGVLNIMNGGLVTAGSDTWVARESGSIGNIHLDNGTLTTGGLGCAVDDITGIGTINTGGIVSDIDLVFNATHGLNQTFNINKNLGQNITVNLNVDGSGLMGAGYGGIGTMNISDGIEVKSPSGYIGYKSGSTGQATINGTGSAWTVTGILYVGRYGNGSLNITDGGAVDCGYGNVGAYSGSTSEVTVDGTDSTWMIHNTLRVGLYGSGKLNITGGGVVNNYRGKSNYIRSESTIGYHPGSMGVVTVDGVGSQWENDCYERFNVGYGGSGVLNVTGGGVVNSGLSSIAGLSGSKGVVTINGVGSIWTVKYLHIGGSPNHNQSTYISGGTGTLNITDGGTVNSDGGIIGFGVGSSGEVNVDGIGSTWTNGSLSICSTSIWGQNPFQEGAGCGRLNITGGGTVSSSTSRIGRECGSTCEVTVDGINSTWTNSGDCRLGNSSNVNVSSCILKITDGGLVSIGGILVIDKDVDDDSFINMSTGGMLALNGDADASDSIGDFLGLVEGSGAIRYWDDSIEDWAHISGATYGEDYTLDYITDGDLAGYTMLTVTAVPEPATLCGMVFGAAAVVRRRRRA